MAEPCMLNKQNKVQPPYDNSICHKVAPFLYSNSAIPFWLQLKHLTFFTLILIIGGIWFVFLGVLLGAKCRFFGLPFLSLGDKNVMIMFITRGMYLSFHFLPCPQPPMGISGVGTMLVWFGGSLIFFKFF